VGRAEATPVRPARLEPAAPVEEDAAEAVAWPAVHLDAAEAVAWPAVQLDAAEAAE
jgi:hypothetical protein